MLISKKDAAGTEESQEQRCHWDYSWQDNRVRQSREGLWAIINGHEAEGSFSSHTHGLSAHHYNATNKSHDSHQCYLLNGNFDIKGIHNIGGAAPD